MRPRGAGRRGRERGAVLLVLMAGLAITAILSAVAVQEWTDVLRRDNEAEMMFRAQEIVRALAKYRRDRGQLPLKLDDLMEPGSKGQYFLRHLYKDPLVKDGKWGLLYMGPGGSIVDPTAPPGDQAGDPAALLPGGTAQNPGSAEPMQPPSTQGDVVTSKFSAAAGEMTGLPIAGVRSLCKDKPFRIYRDRVEYSEWLFTLLDLETPQVQQPGQPPPPSPSPRQNPSGPGSSNPPPGRREGK